MEPKNCPFCKNEFVDIYIEESYYAGLRHSNVYCGTCGAEGPHVDIDSFDSEEFDEMESEDIKLFMIEKAIEAWNSRC